MNSLSCGEGAQLQRIQNTWELPNNIPDHKIAHFDLQQQKERSDSRREGLRESRRAPVRNDFIRTF